MKREVRLVSESTRLSCIAHSMGDVGLQTILGVAETVYKVKPEALHTIENFAVLLTTGHSLLW